MRTRDFIVDIERTNRGITTAKFGSQLNSATKRAELQKIVDRYFSEVRPSFAASEEQGSLIQAVDDAMQALLVQCHKRGQTARYKKLLNSARDALIQVEAAQLLPSASPEVSRDGVDTRIIASLDSILPSAALAYIQAIEDLRTERLSWRGPATDLRESMREVLDLLAPDREVESASGFKREPDTRGPTMKQKVRHVLRKRDQASAATASAESAVVAVEEAVDAFVRSVYTRSSVSTHTATSRDEVLRIKSLVQVVLQELLDLRD